VDSDMWSSVHLFSVMFVNKPQQAQGQADLGFGAYPKRHRVIHDHFAVAHRPHT
jgi:hypothetical protein